LVGCALEFNISAQSTLTAGDIAFVAINSDGSDDQFSFLLLNHVSSGTEINFTDNGWTAGGSFNALYPESHFNWMATSDLEAGTVVHITTYNGNALPVASNGVITGEMMTVSVAGDQLLAYQGDKLNPVFIAVISFNQNNDTAPGLNFDEDSQTNATTALPNGLQMGESAVHIYHPDDLSEQDNARYNCSVTEGTPQELLQALCNKDNWQTDNETPFEVDPFPCTFVVDVPTDIDTDLTLTYDVRVNVLSDKIVLEFGNDRACEVKLYNVNGVLTDSFRKSQGVIQSELQSSGLAKGMYLLAIVYDDKTITRKVIL
jgi:hypothetical protein